MFRKMLHRIFIPISIIHNIYFASMSRLIMSHNGQESIYVSLLSQIVIRSPLAHYVDYGALIHWKVATLACMQKRPSFMLTSAKSQPFHLSMSQKCKLLVWFLQIPLAAPSNLRQLWRCMMKLLSYMWLICRTQMSPRNISTEVTIRWRMMGDIEK